MPDNFTRIKRGSLLYQSIFQTETNGCNYSENEKFKVERIWYFTDPDAHAILNSSLAVYSCLPVRIVINNSNLTIMKILTAHIKSRVIASITVPFILLTMLASPPAAAQGPAPDKLSKAISGVHNSSSELNTELKMIYKATNRFQDVNVALEEGYIRDPMNMCEEASLMGMPSHVGAMGVHYFRPDLLGITGSEPRVNGTGTYTNFRKPAILIYEPQKDGSMELIAVENLVFADAWHKKHGDKLPEFMGYEYFSMTDNPRTKTDEAHMFEPHYDLHIWLFRENPNGLFTPFNPNVTCEYHNRDLQKSEKTSTNNSGHDMKKSNH